MVYNCPKCGNVFTTKQSLERHTNTARYCSRVNAVVQRDQEIEELRGDIDSLRETVDSFRDSVNSQFSELKEILFRSLKIVHTENSSKDDIGKKNKFSVKHHLLYLDKPTRDSVETSFLECKSDDDFRREFEDLTRKLCDYDSVTDRWYYTLDFAGKKERTYIVMNSRIDEFDEMRQNIFESVESIPIISEEVTKVFYDEGKGVRTKVCDFIFYTLKDKLSMIKT